MEKSLGIKAGTRRAVLAAAVLALGASGAAAGSADSSSKSGGLFPNDAGPAKIDVQAYPEEMRGAYHLFLSKCSQCHTVARPINAQFLELSPEELAEAKKTHPEMFADKLLLQPAEGIWKRYVQRMMHKPGCSVQSAEGKKIWEFLVYDSKARKSGANAAAWIAHRKKLLKTFKQDHPADYQRLFPDDIHTASAKE